MTVRVSGRDYAARPIPAGVCGVKAVRLTKPDGDTYDLVLTRHGTLECSCGQYEFRLRNTDQLCKHAVAIVAAGLMPTPRPRPARQT